MKLGVWDSKYVVILYPPPTGHMVVCMCIVNITIKPTYAHMVRPDQIRQDNRWGGRVYMGQPRPHPNGQGPASIVEFKDFLDSTKEGTGKLKSLNGVQDEAQ